MKSKIECRVYPTKSKKAKKAGILANATVTINGEFACKDLVIREGKKGAFVSFPTKKVDNDYMDIFFPVTAEARKEIIDLLLETYEEAYYE